MDRGSSHLSCAEKEWSLTWLWVRQAWSFLFALHLATLSLVFSRRSRTLNATRSLKSDRFWDVFNISASSTRGSPDLPAEAEANFSPAPCVCSGFGAAARFCAAYILRKSWSLWSKAEQPDGVRHQRVWLPQTGVGRSTVAVHLRGNRKYRYGRVGQPAATEDRRFLRGNICHFISTSLNSIFMNFHL